MGCCDTPGLMPISEALEKMLSSVTVNVAKSTLALEESIGFVLAEDLRSPIFVPPFDNSAMDATPLDEKISLNPIPYLKRVSRLQGNHLMVNGQKEPVFAS